MSAESDFTWSELGSRIRDARLSKGMSQEELAAQTGLSQPGLFRIEAGNTNPQIQSVAKIAAALGCSIRELLCGRMAESADSEEAALLTRMRRILSSGDEVAISVIRNALVSAETILQRGREGGLIRRPYTGPARELLEAAQFQKRIVRLRGDKRTSDSGSSPMLQRSPGTGGTQPGNLEAILKRRGEKLLAARTLKLPQPGGRDRSRMEDETE